MKPKTGVTAEFLTEMWPIDRPQDYPKNARKWTDKAIAKVAASIREFGFRQGIRLDAMVGGHGKRRVVADH